VRGLNVSWVLVADRDVGQIGWAFTPGQADAHQFGPKGVEAGGFGVEGHRLGRVGCGQHPCHQGLEASRGGDQLGPELGRGR